MTSHKFVLVYVCLLWLTATYLPLNAQYSQADNDSISGSSSATQERPQDDSARQSGVDLSPLAALTQTVSTLFGPLLAQAIRSTRDHVYPHGHPMPVALRRQLSPFFPRTVLEKVRYSTEWDPAEDPLPSLFLGNNTKSAMTLGDVILFRDTEGVADPLLWAHELTHVMQYEQLGIPAFATRYLTQGWELEAEAMAKADAIGHQLSP